MRILVITLNAWNISNSTGNTISNLFAGWDSNDIANIYCREESIDNQVCEKYFKITENEILHSLFRSSLCGKYFERTKDTTPPAKYNPLGRNKVGEFLRRLRPILLVLFRELIWKSCVWKNKKLRSFLIEFSPDVIYMHGHYNIYMHNLLLYCAEVTGAKVVTYWGDDMYNRKNYYPIHYLYETQLRKAFKKTIMSSSLLLAGSPKLNTEYSAIFNKAFVTFIKECKIPAESNKSFSSDTIKIVYAGNLLFGREKAMLSFAKTINEINQHSTNRKFQLVVYSGTIPSKKALIVLNDRKNCLFEGRKPYEFVCSEMDRADLCLFLESFEKRYKKLTRLSFSTKIIDCLQSSSAMIAIGPSDIASMEYVINSGIAYVISDEHSMKSDLERLINEADILLPKLEYEKREFAINNHTNTKSFIIEQIKRLK